MNEDGIFEKLGEMFNSMPNNFSILQEQIDISTQMEYFEASKSVKKKEGCLEVKK